MRTYLAGTKDAPIGSYAYYNRAAEMGYHGVEDTTGRAFIADKEGRPYVMGRKS